MKQNPSADALLLASRIQQELETYVDPVKRTYLPGFFKTGKGQYGEGDEFLGIVVPNTRLVAKRHKAEPFEVAAALLQSRWHECRLCALLMLVERFKKCDEMARKEIVDFYLAHTTRINNWDLVDLSAPYILGEYLKDKPRDVLHRLASSTLLWDQRIAVVATQTLIKNGDFTDILLLAPRFFQTPHDLMQKAVGWMLREVGKKDEAVLVSFLQQHARSMPRTMLRYAIEKFPDGQRREFMKR